MRVRIDEAGHDDAVRRVEALDVRELRGARRDLIARADGRDAPILDEDRAAADDREIALDDARERPVAARRRRARDDLASVLDEAFRVLRDDRLRVTYLSNLVE